MVLDVWYKSGTLKRTFTNSPTNQVVVSQVADWLIHGLVNSWKWLMKIWSITLLSVISV